MAVMEERADSPSDLGVVDIEERAGAYEPPIRVPNPKTTVPFVRRKMIKRHLSLPDPLSVLKQIWMS